jgi:hypothetical protein
VEPADCVGHQVAALARLDQAHSTGDLLLVWNDHSDIPAGLVKRRVPLSTAISRDDGRTWECAKALEGNPKGWYCYSAICPAGDAVLLAYCAMSGLAHSRITRVPIAWLCAESVAEAAGAASKDGALFGFFND